MFKKKNRKNIFIYVAVILALSLSGYLYFSQNSNFSFSNLSNIFSLNDNVYNVYTEGTNDINIDGVISINDSNYNYYGTFTETYMILENVENVSTEFAVQKIGSGVIGFDNTKQQILIEIDFEDTNEDDKNVRQYLLSIETKDDTIQIEKEVILKNPHSSPIEGLNFKNIFKKHNVLK